MATLAPGQAGPLPAYSAQNRVSGIRGVRPAFTPHGATILSQTWSGDPKDKDPASGILGMPPNLGEGLLPHVITHQGIISSVSRIYRPSDEAIKDSFDNARFMRNDPVIMECVELRQRSTALLDWHLEPDNEKDERQVQLCDDLKLILENIPRFMQYRENLLHATWYGRYGCQHRFRWKKLRNNMRIVCNRWLPVNGDKIVFRYDDGTQEYDPDQVGIRVGAGFTTGTSVAKAWTAERINKVEPTDYGLAYFLEAWERPLLALHKHYIEDGEYEEPANAGRIHGVGLRSRLYWIWYQKQETLAQMVEYLERSATGIEIWYYPWGDPQAEARTRAAAEERIGPGRNIVLVPRPMGEEGQAYGVERIEPGMAGIDALHKLVTEYFGWQIKRMILGQTLTTESGATGLGSNLASVHLDTFMQIVRYDSALLEETITTDLVEPLKRFNFPWAEDIPIRFRIDTEAPDAESKLEAFMKAWEMGLKIPVQQVRDLIGVPKPDKDQEVLDKAEQEQAMGEAQQQQQMAMQGQQQGHDASMAMAQHQYDASQTQQAQQHEQQLERTRAQVNGWTPSGPNGDADQLTRIFAQRGMLAPGLSSGVNQQEAEVAQQGQPFLRPDSPAGRPDGRGVADEPPPSPTGDPPPPSQDSERTKIAEYASGRGASSGTNPPGLRTSPEAVFHGDDNRERYTAVYAQPWAGGQNVAGGNVGPAQEWKYEADEPNSSTGHPPDLAELFNREFCRRGWTLGGSCRPESYHRLRYEPGIVGRLLYSWSPVITTKPIEKITGPPFHPPIKEKNPDPGQRHYAGWQNTDGPPDPGPAVKATPFSAERHEEPSLVDLLNAEFGHRGWNGSVDRYDAAFESNHPRGSGGKFGQPDLSGWDKTQERHESLPGQRGLFADLDVRPEKPKKSPQRSLFSRPGIVERFNREFGRRGFPAPPRLPHASPERTPRNLLTAMLRREFYCRGWRERGAQVYRYDKQGTFTWKEGEHPRDDAGKFAEKEGGGAAVADPPKKTGLSDEQNQKRQAWEDMQRRIMDDVDDALGLKSSLAGPIRAEYRKTVERILLYMTPTAMKRLRSGAEMHFYPDMKSLQEMHHVISGSKKSGSVGGFFSWYKVDERALPGDVHIDGAPGWSDSRNTYAHEFAHVVDGPGYPLSSTDEWRMAWDSEIAPDRKNGVGYGYKFDDPQPPLSAYATTSPQEGWAEFGRLVFTNPREARDRFPMAWNVWHDHHLVAGEKADAPPPDPGKQRFYFQKGAKGGQALPEIFERGETVEHEGQTIHADILIGDDGNKTGGDRGKPG